MAPASLRALLTGLIDYAGLFPPAALPLADVARNYGTYLQSVDRWALGRLVVPAARLGELVGVVHATATPWPLTVLVGDDVAGDAARIAAVADTPHIAVESAEVRATTVAQIRSAVGALFSVPEVYVELPLSTDLPTLVKAVADVGVRAKIRTGGVTADAIPSAADCARFIDACASRRVPFKATAGLHHPVRGRYALTYAPDAPRGEMFGFLNIFIAAALARTGVDSKEVEYVLGETDARSFEFGAVGMSWRSHSLSLHDLQATRQSLAITFGSCSFREPLDDLTQLGLL
ncbi:hypothetical protein BH09GEM1_BH09GEM1_06230 [soil metagenome]